MTVPLARIPSTLTTSATWSVAGPLPTQTRADYACAVRASTVDQALYITLKTVEDHLARVYGKLKISSRGELARGVGDERTGVPTL